MNKTISRRDFLKYSMGGMAVLVVGSKLSWLTQGTPYAQAAVQTIELSITDALKNMHTHNDINTAQCYLWVFKSTNPALPAECPGPSIIAARGDTINIQVTNELDEPHSFFIPGFAPGDAALVDSGSIPAKPAIPDGTNVWNGVIDLSTAQPGAYLYFDNENAPVGRVMGLHGALIVMPTEADRNGTHKLTPYSNAGAPLAATHGVQVLYNSFGAAHFPGLAWEQGDATPWSMNLGPNGHTEPDFMPLAFPGLNRPNCPPFRQYIWLLHQPSPNLFAEVGSLGAGDVYDSTAFMNAFLRDPFSPTRANRIPQYFTINGQSGFFSHFSPTVTMMGRVGEPAVVHILNAGLWTHSMHLHANHFFVTSVNGLPQPNPVWVDVFRVDPMDRIDYTVPYMKPPDIGQVKGIGPISATEPPLTTANGHPVWPPVEEFAMYMPNLGTTASAAPGDPLGRTTVELGQRMSPMCYPMHDHSEPSQTSQGGNYNTGLISGMYFTGDRNGMMDFPMDEDFWMGYQNIRGVAATSPAALPFGEVM